MKQEQGQEMEPIEVMGVVVSPCKIVQKIDHFETCWEVLCPNGDLLCYCTTKKDAEHVQYALMVATISALEHCSGEELAERFRKWEEDEKAKAKEGGNE